MNNPADEARPPANDPSAAPDPSAALFPGVRRTAALERRVFGAAVGSLAFVWIADDALAQAGGGGSYGSGGGSGGGGGGDGLGYLIYWLIRLAIQAPAIGVPLLIVVLIVAYKSQKGGRRRFKGRTIRRGRSARESARTRVSTDGLKERDPDFDATRFVARVSEAFRLGQESWCRQDLAPIRHFVSDGIYERFSLQVEEQKEDGWRQGMEGLRVVGAPQIVHVGSDAHFDTIAVSIRFEADIHRLSLETGKRIRGSEVPFADFVECWSFLRRRGAHTNKVDGLMEGQCPNCSSKLEMSMSAECGSCGSLVRSGEYDWVLAEITQASEWKAEDASRVPGLVAYQESDPGMNVQSLEDRASVMFWRKVAADRVASNRPLKNIATERLLSDYREKVADQGDEKGRIHDGDCAVGSVETLGLLKGEEFDRALLEVRWDGRKLRLGKDGQRSPVSDRIMRRSIFVMKRDAGATSAVEQTFSSAHCASCGAPDTRLEASACGFCGTPLKRGSDWKLDAILGMHDPEARELIREVRSLGKPERRPQEAGDVVLGVAAGALGPAQAGVLAWTLKMAVADGAFTRKEREAIDRLAKQCDVSEDRLQVLIDAATKDRGDLPSPADQAEARKWLGAMLEIALADGRLTGPERKLLDLAAESAGVTKKDLRRMEDAVMDSLYRETKAENKRRRAEGRG